MSSGLFSALPS